MKMIQPMLETEHFTLEYHFILEKKKIETGLIKNFGGRNQVARSNGGKRERHL